MFDDDLLHPIGSLAHARASSMCFCAALAAHVPAGKWRVAGARPPLSLARCMAPVPLPAAKSPSPARFSATRSTMRRSGWSGASGGRSSRATPRWPRPATSTSTRTANAGRRTSPRNPPPPGPVHPRNDPRLAGAEARAALPAADAPPVLPLHYALGRPPVRPLRARATGGNRPPRLPDAPRRGRAGCSAEISARDSPAAGMAKVSDSVIIIGAGVFGAWTAHHLLKVRGVRSRSSTRLGRPTAARPQGANPGLSAALTVG